MVSGGLRTGRAADESGRLVQQTLILKGFSLFRGGRLGVRFRRLFDRNRVLSIQNRTEAVDSGAVFRADGL